MNFRGAYNIWHHSLCRQCTADRRGGGQFGAPSSSVHPERTSMHHRRPWDTAGRDSALYIARPERGTLAGGPQRSAASVHVAFATSLSSPLKLNRHAHQLLSRHCPPGYYRCGDGLETFVIVSITINIDVLLLPWPLGRLDTIHSSFRSNVFLGIPSGQLFAFLKRS